MILPELIETSGIYLRESIFIYMALCFDKGFHPKVVALNMASDHRYYMSSMFNLYMHASLPIYDNQNFLLKPNRFGSKITSLL